MTTFGKAVQARELLISSLKEQAGHPILCVGLARQMVATKHFASVRSVLAPIIDSTSTHSISKRHRAKALTILAQSKALQGQIDLALKFCNQALSVDGSYVGANELVLRIYYNSKQYNKAVVEGRRLTLDFKESGTIHLVYGAALQKTGQFKSAMGHLTLAYKKGVQDPLVFISKAQCEMRLDRYTDAVRTIAVGRSVYPGHPAIERMYKSLKR